MGTALWEALQSLLVELHTISERYVQITYLKIYYAQQSAQYKYSFNNIKTYGCKHPNVQYG